MGICENPHDICENPHEICENPYTLNSLSSLLNSDFGKLEVAILGSIHDYGLLTT